MGKNKLSNQEDLPQIDRPLEQENAEMVSGEIDDTKKDLRQLLENQTPDDRLASVLDENSEHSLDDLMDIINEENGKVDEGVKIAAADLVLKLEHKYSYPSEQLFNLMDLIKKVPARRSAGIDTLIASECPKDLLTIAMKECPEEEMALRERLAEQALEGDWEKVDHAIWVVEFVPSMAAQAAKMILKNDPRPDLCTLIVNKVPDVAEEAWGKLANSYGS